MLLPQEKVHAHSAIPDALPCPSNLGAIQGCFLLLNRSEFKGCCARRNMLRLRRVLTLTRRLQQRVLRC